jgi:hypothetical protein
MSTISIPLALRLLLLPPLPPLPVRADFDAVAADGGGTNFIATMISPRYEDMDEMEEELGEKCIWECDGEESSIPVSAWRKYIK